MSDLSVQCIDAKHIRISGIEPFLADCLQGLGEVLDQRDSPAAGGRLSPDPTAADSKTNTDWRKTVAPELRHLFVSAGDTVVRDLIGLKTDDGDASLYQITFPAEHVNAWMSALNQGRLILGELFHITEEDMNGRKFDTADARTLAIVRIHMLGYLLQLFVELETGDSGIGRDEPKDSV